MKKDTTRSEVTALTLCSLLYDRLAKLYLIPVRVVYHVRPVHHVLVEVAGIQEDGWQSCLPDVVVNLVLA